VVIYRTNYDHFGRERGSTPLSLRVTRALQEVLPTMIDRPYSDRPFDAEYCPSTKLNLELPRL